MTETTNDMERYIRQMTYPPFGEEGQRKLLSSRALLCGCGGLGSNLSSTLVRAGLGFLRIVDRDNCEMNNLQRQIVYDEKDAMAGVPKAFAARDRLMEINSEVEIEAIVEDVTPETIEKLVLGMDLIIDGTDNFATRYILNDVAVKHGIPWVYGGCVGAEGQAMTIIPGDTPCLRCLIPQPPAPETTPTCAVVGVMAPIVQVIAAFQAIDAIKILSGHPEAINRSLNVFELWDNRMRQINIDNLREAADCPTCKHREFTFLKAK